MEGVFKKELIMRLGYFLYTFRVDSQLTESEMLEVLRSLMETNQFKKEYGMEER